MLISYPILCRKFWMSFSKNNSKINFLTKVGNVCNCCTPRVNHGLVFVFFFNKIQYCTKVCNIRIYVFQLAPDFGFNTH